MLNEILSFIHLSGWQYLTIALVALMVGMGKAGISGIVVVAVPILASILGGKESTGMMTMIFILGDFFAVSTYRRHAMWSDPADAARGDWRHFDWQLCRLLAE
jgi:hypothetical protein